MNEEARKKISVALSRLCTTQPFFGVLALHLKPTEVKGLGTMATDGYKLLYDPDWTLEKLSVSECETVVSHEALHAVFEHPFRQKATKFPRHIYLQATEHAVNNVLNDSGYQEPKIGWVMDQKYKGWSTEKICKDLHDQEKKEEQGQDGQDVGETGIGEGCCLKEPEGGNLNQQQLQDKANEMKIRLSKAAAAAKAAGNLPAGLDILIEDTLYPSVDWTSKIRQFFETVIDGDYNWLKPSEEFLDHGIYLPSMYDEAIVRPIVFAVDTSASMSREELNQIFAEISSIMSDLKPKEIHIIYADADVEGHDEFSCEDLPIHTKAKPKGGGGTNFKPAFSYVENEGIDPLCFIYLTDMCCNSYPSKEPDYPVLWGNTSSEEHMFSTPPFGEAINIDV